MASSDLRAELECSVCLNVYADPVTLGCGHNFCRVCIDRVLDTQEGSRGYCCPECRQEFGERPTLQRNTTLYNIVENLQSSESDQEASGVFCTHCLHAPIPAIKSCLHCEASLCGDHLRVHSKSPEHVLSDPTTTLKTRKCPVHKKILEYYCTQDSACICVSCCLIGEHKGHEMKSLDEASEEQKKKLRNVLQKLMMEKEKTEEQVRSLEEWRREEQEKADREAERITILFGNLRRQLEDLEKKLLSEISGKAEEVALSVNDLIYDLDMKMDKLTSKMGHIEELCTATDPLTILQDTGDLWNAEEEDDGNQERVGLDVAGISRTLHVALFDIMTGVTGGIHILKAVDLLLDKNTAHCHLFITEDRKGAAGPEDYQVHPPTPQRFQSFQAMTSQSISSGRYYWDIKGGNCEYWGVGVCYPSIVRKGVLSCFGNNNKSWHLSMWVDEDDDGNDIGDRCIVKHDGKEVTIPGKNSDTVRVYVDYEAGQISFYALCPQIRHLHTFSATFTEPLHATLTVGDGCVKMI